MITRAASREVSSSRSAQAEAVRRMAGRSAGETVAMAGWSTDLRVIEHLGQAEAGIAQSRPETPYLRSGFMQPFQRRKRSRCDATAGGRESSQSQLFTDDDSEPPGPSDESPLTIAGYEGAIQHPLRPRCPFLPYGLLHQGIVRPFHGPPGCNRRSRRHVGEKRLSFWDNLPPRRQVV